jgi:hypothetical protein
VAQQTERLGVLDEISRQIEALHDARRQTHHLHVLARHVGGKQRVVVVAFDRTKRCASWHVHANAIRLRVRIHGRVLFSHLTHDTASSSNITRSAKSC